MSNFIHEYNRAQDYGFDSLYYRYEKLIQKAINYDMAYCNKSRVELEKCTIEIDRDFGKSLKI